MSLLKKPNLKKKRKKETKYFIKISNGKIHDNVMSNLKDEIVISAQVLGLLSFCMP